VSAVTTAAALERKSSAPRRSVPRTPAHPPACQSRTRRSRNRRDARSTSAVGAATQRAISLFPRTCSQTALHGAAIYAEGRRGTAVRGRKTRRPPVIAASRDGKCPRRRASSHKQCSCHRCLRAPGTFGQRRAVVDGAWPGSANRFASSPTGAERVAEPAPQQRRSG
jgi:hypothetical protein